MLASYRQVILRLEDDWSEGVPKSRHIETTFMVASRGGRVCDHALPHGLTLLATAGAGGFNVSPLQFVLVGGELGADLMDEVVHFGNDLFLAGNLASQLRDDSVVDLRSFDYVRNIALHALLALQPQVLGL